jgi:hypothetical protein
MKNKSRGLVSMSCSTTHGWVSLLGRILFVFYFYFFFLYFHLSIFFPPQSVPYLQAAAREQGSRNSSAEYNWMAQPQPKLPSCRDMGYMSTLLSVTTLDFSVDPVDNKIRRKTSPWFVVCYINGHGKLHGLENRQYRNVPSRILQPTGKYLEAD